ncbi:MAG: glycosyltransferase family 117 protein [Janthinobacterium lividum]
MTEILPSMKYNKINNLFGWLAFALAALTYILTLEPFASFWDCGEFIACAYRLQVAHQPGAPLFTIIGKVFSLFAADKTKVAYMVNMSSALASAATILFLFWTITALAKKIVVKTASEIDLSQTILIIGSGLVGSLAYAWSDTFWFSAVESEVYAQSSLCTAIVFWAIMKWDAHADEPGADKWIIFIAYVMGLSIGIHLLNLLAIPAIACVYYFRRTPNATGRGTLTALFIGVIIVAAVLWGIIQYVVKGAAYADLLFVNTLNFGFWSGATVFFILIVITMATGIMYTIKPVKQTILVSAVAFILLLAISGGIIGGIVGIAIVAFLEYVVKIRGKRVALNMILTCTVFILFGYSSFAMLIIRSKAHTNLNNSEPNNAFALLSYLNRDQYGDTPLLYGQYYDSKAVDQKEGASIYRKGKERYEVAGKKQNLIYDRNTLFPRMFSDKAEHVGFYKDWMHISEGQSPTFADNLGFFFSWQVNQMYTRYLLWNFAGRQNDADGQNNNATDGNWISGIKPIDALRLGNQSALSPTMTMDKSYNRLFFLPLILGLIGAFYHFKRNQKDAGVVGLMFFFTGFAILLYLNQDPLQPRERDYAYAGSFYAFAIWIGLGTLFIAEKLRKVTTPQLSAIGATVVCLLAAPVLMAFQEWDDHDRSTKTTPRDMAYNYLNSCAPNAILFTYGDNDTYPLWYIQEVENVRPDVRIVNLSLLGTDWYMRQMKQKMNESSPLPITLPNEKFEAGVRDVTYYNDSKIPGNVELKEVFDFITSDDARAKVEYENGQSMNYMPTKNLKLTINADEVVKTGTVPAAEKGRIPSEIDWKYPGNYVTKDNLAMMDILAHNNWKRPIYFAITVGNDNMMGLDKYMYNEGFASRLMPFTADTAASGGGVDRSNTLKMYNNVMTKFRWGNMKNATYLDHESRTMFYPVILRTFLSLTENLYKEGHPDLAKKVLHRYDEVMPDLNPYTDVAIRKFYLADLAYQLNERKLGEKIVNQISSYASGQLNYFASMDEGNQRMAGRDIQLCISVINELIKLTKDNNEPAQNQKLTALLNTYQAKFRGMFQQQPQ